jgi:PleD family two-component response regulator
LLRLFIISDVIVYKVITEPSVYLWDVELVSFLMFVTATMATITSLSQQLAKMRNRLKAQTQELEQALTHIEKIAAHDELTGLINRRRMTEVLAEHSRNNSRQTEGFAIAMLDLDHFKSINDKYGHATGDMVLSNFGQAARRSIARY